MKSKRKTNVQVIKEIMEHSEFGAMAQIFVVEGIRQYAEVVSETKPEELGINSIINPDLWIKVAKEVKEKIETCYGEGN